MKKSIVESGIHLLMAIGILFWIEILVVSSARADDLKGFEEPALQTAIETWLLDNDEGSLPVFSALATEGNIAARLLLARIEATDQGPSNYLTGLSRKERVELFRSNSGKGMFRPTWLKSEKKAGNQMAATFLDSADTVVNLDAIRVLYEIGEPEAAYDLIREAAGNGTQEQKEQLAQFLPDNSELMPFLRALQNPVAGFTIGHAAMQQCMGSGELEGSKSDTRAAANFVEHGYQTGVQNSDFDQSNHYYGDLASWIETSPVTTPIATLCRRYCGDDTRDCAITAFGLVGGYYKAIKFDSPMQTLIEQARYVSSDRAVGMVLRRVSFARPAGASRKLLISNDELHAKSACLAEVVTAVRAQRN
ncbi:hypothetical protein N8198_00705 [Gammaproteobacteria bacterium]|nr:hypothetical protein [Gammaproteobacteria bacterium]